MKDPKPKTKHNTNFKVGKTYDKPKKKYKIGSDGSEDFSQS